MFRSYRTGVSRTRNIDHDSQTIVRVRAHRTSMLRTHGESTICTNISLNVSFFFFSSFVTRRLSVTDTIIYRHSLDAANPDIR